MIDIELDSIESGTGRLLNQYSSKGMSSAKNIFTTSDVLYGKLRPYLRKFYKPTFNGVCSSEFWVFSPRKITQSFLYHFISTNRFNIETNKTCGTKMPRADWDKIKGLEFYYPNGETQDKISVFLDLIDKKIKLLILKIETLKKYREGLKKCSLLFLEKKGIEATFKELFVPINERNHLGLKQYTVGKFGVKELDEDPRYELQNHKTFRSNELIVGIGIEEIGFSDGINGCVSPVYDVFRIRNSVFIHSLKESLKQQLWKHRNVITKKSTRREFEVDRKELMKVKLLVLDNEEYETFYRTLCLCNSSIDLLERKLNKIISCKTFLLSNMFI